MCHGTHSGARECQELNGRQLNTPIKFALASPLPLPDMTIYACARDLSTRAIASEYFENTSKNPENITVTAVSKIPTSTVKDPPVIEDEEAAGGNSDTSANPYCDEVNYTVECFDRKDYDQETGLYPCNDGSYVGDWRDCPDTSSNDDEEEE